MRMKALLHDQARLSRLVVEEGLSRLFHIEADCVCEDPDLVLS